MNDDELEAMFRASLRDHAEDVADVGGRAEAARRGLRRRHRVQAVVGAAALVLLAAPVGVLAATQHPARDEAAQPGEQHPRGWRVESYNGVELKVPASWAWGFTPATADGTTVQCTARAFPLATSAMDVRPPRGGALSVPYVGRPPATSDGCTRQRLPQSVAHVWFGSPQPVGVDPVAGTTLRVRGVTITVFDPNRQLEGAIVATVREAPVDSNGCTATPPEQPLRDPALEPDDVTSTSVCVYFARPLKHRGISIRSGYLYYSTRVRGDASTLAHAIRDAPRSNAGYTDNLCLGGAPSDIDLIEHSGGASNTYTVLPFDCPGHPFVYQGEPDRHLLRSDNVALWAIDGVPLYARGDPEGNRLLPFLPQ